MQTVLIGFAEALAAIETAWSLQEAGFKVVAFQRKGSHSALNRVRGVEVHTVPAPERDAAAAAAAIAALAERLRPAALLPLDDHAVWLLGHMPGLDVPVAGPVGSAAEYALDKRLQLLAAARAGLALPQTQVLGTLEGFSPQAWPLFLKPARALYEVDGRLTRPTGEVCADAAELQRAARRSWHSPILAQPQIHGVGEGLFGHMTSDGVVGWSSHQRVRMVNPQGSASSCCVSREPDPALLKPVTRFLASIGWRGLFMVELLRDSDGVPWFMELNGRPWGSMALARRRGYEYPAWAVSAAIDPGFVPAVPLAPPEVVCRNLGLELVHLMFVVRGPRSSAPGPWPGLGATVRALCTRGPRDRLYNWRRSQPDVLMADTAFTLWTYLRKLGRRRA
jgi:hypothetical protein